MPPTSSPTRTAASWNSTSSNRQLDEELAAALGMAKDSEQRELLSCLNGKSREQMLLDWLKKQQ